MMILDSNFELHHGARWWSEAVGCALAQQVWIPSEPPAVCVSVIWSPDPQVESYQFAASVGAINTDAAIVIFEWMVVNPLLPLRVRHRAIEHLMHAGRIYATAVGKRIITLNTPIGVRKLAERVGFAWRNKDLEVLEGDKP